MHREIPFYRIIPKGIRRGILELILSYVSNASSRFFIGS